MLFILLAYLCGSIPSGILVARALGLSDPRQSGSGNIGASNLARIGGRKVGVLTFLLDFTKGCVPVLLALFMSQANQTVIYLTAFAAVLGHCYSVFLLFNGGKGVATAAGALFPVAPIPMVGAFIAWGLCFYCFRITSLAAMAALLVLSGALLFIGAEAPLLAVGIACAVVVVRRHEANLKSLLEGSERKF